MGASRLEGAHKERCLLEVVRISCVAFGKRGSYDHSARAATSHALFPSNRIEVIPNAIDLDEYPVAESSQQERERLILFVGRIEPKKGVDILLYAFVAAHVSSNWQVAIIGPVWSSEYQAELAQIVAENGLGDRITFLGAVFGEEKRRWMRKVWLLAVPSHSEVVGLVNLEATAYCVPCITTHQTGLHDWELGEGC